MPGPRPTLKPGYDNAGRRLPAEPISNTLKGPNRRSVFQSYQSLPRPARIAISGSFFLFALAGYYYEPYVMPLPSHSSSSTGGVAGTKGGDVLVDAREGERLPVRLTVVDRSATRGL